MQQQWLKNRLPSNGQVLDHLDNFGGTGSSAGAFWCAPIFWLKRQLTDPKLWHINRRSVAGAVATGLFVAWLPVPMQMLVAAVLAAMMRVHVPLSIVLVWVSNPITFPFMLYAAWWIGSILLGTDMTLTPLSMNLGELIAAAMMSWKEILLGSVFCAAVSAVLGYIATLKVWRYMTVWRWLSRANY